MNNKEHIQSLGSNNLSSNGDLSPPLHLKHLKGNNAGINSSLTKSPPQSHKKLKRSTQNYVIQNSENQMFDVEYSGGPHSYS